MKLGPRRRPKNTKGARQTSVVADLFLRDAREAIKLLPKACLAASKPRRRRNVLADRPLRAGCPNRHVENDPGGRAFEERARERFDSGAHPIEINRPLAHARGGDRPSFAVAQVQRDGQDALAAASSRATAAISRRGRIDASVRFSTRPDTPP